MRAPGKVRPVNQLRSARAMTEPVHVIGATGRSGQALCRSLLADGVPVVPVVRDVGRWRAARLWAEPRMADLSDTPSLAPALADARRIVCGAHARHVPAILAASPPQASFVFLGSTRKFTRWPDDHGRGVRAGEEAFHASGRPGVMLHPTMIYGAEGEDNVQRLAALLRRLPFVPLPGGGRALVQPIHQDDVTRCVRAALNRRWDGPHSLVIAGPRPVSYARFVRAVAEASGLPPRPVLPLPAVLLVAAAMAARCVPGLPRIRTAEIRRLLEDKAFDIVSMTAWLEVSPIGLEEGLAATFSQSG